MDFLSAQLSGGLLADTRRLDMAANNLANQGTSGYQSMMARPEVGPAVAIGRAPRTANLSQTVSVTFSGRVDSERQLAPGALVTTGIPTNIALTGPGYFAVSKGGATLYTRAGDFRPNAKGELALPDGARLLNRSGQPMVIPAGASAVTVGRNGDVSATVAGRPLPLGQILVVGVSNPQGLSAQGGTLLATTVASGPARPLSLGGATEAHAGMMEASNVDLSSALVNTMEAADAFAMKAKLLALNGQMQHQLDQLA